MVVDLRKQPNSSLLDHLIAASRSINTWLQSDPANVALVLQASLEPQLLTLRAGALSARPDAVHTGARMCPLWVHGSFQAQCSASIRGGTDWLGWHLVLPLFLCIASSCSLRGFTNTVRCHMRI